MIDIMCVSDEEVFLQNKENRKIDLLISAGDLSPGYLDYLVNEFKPTFSIMVHGNHDKKFFSKTYEEENYSFSKVYKGIYVLNHGIINLKKFINKDIVVAGFSGALSYGYRPFHFSENDVLKFKREIFFKSSFRGNEYKFIDIMVTHNAPYVKGTIQRYSQSHPPSINLGKLFYSLRPKIWIYGHIHPRYGQQELDFVIENSKHKCYLINAIPYKFIKYDEENKEVVEIETFKRIEPKLVLINQ